MWDRYMDARRVARHRPGRPARQTVELSLTRQLSALLLVPVWLRELWWNLACFAAPTRMESRTRSQAKADKKRL